MPYYDIYGNVVQTAGQSTKGGFGPFLGEYGALETSRGVPSTRTSVTTRKVGATPALATMGINLGPSVTEINQWMRQMMTQLQPEVGAMTGEQNQILAQIAALLAKFGPAILAGLGGTALGGLLGGAGGEASIGSGSTPTAEGLKWPWETPKGEGFIAPWTPQVTLPSGLTGQLGAGYAGQNVAYSWSTGTAEFFRLTDGRIAVQKKNGVWKLYRPAKHIVIPRDPKIGTLLRAHKKVNKMVSRLASKVPRKSRKSIVYGPEAYLSPVERKALKVGA